MSGGLVEQSQTLLKCKQSSNHLRIVRRLTARRQSQYLSEGRTSIAAVGGPSSFWATFSSISISSPAVWPVCARASVFDHREFGDRPAGWTTNRCARLFVRARQEEEGSSGRPSSGRYRYGATRFSKHHGCAGLVPLTTRAIPVLQSLEVVGRLPRTTIDQPRRTACEVEILRGFEPQERL